MLLLYCFNNIKIHNNFVNPGNINEILKKNGFIDNIDLFSIDIDGIDYWVIKELKPEISKIFILNPFRL